MRHDTASLAGQATKRDDPPAPLFAAASHDLRQPLQAMGLLLDRLAMRPLDLEARVIVATLDRLVSGMGELLEALHDAVQTESGLLKPQFADVPVADVLGQVVATFGPAASAKGVDLHVVSSSATVHSDRRMLERILSNITSNAIKYTNSGGRIVVGCRRERDRLRVEIHDNGMGIPAADLERIFERFKRLNPGDGRRGSLGLGLHIVRLFADALGAQVQIRSQQGKGTTVAVLLPLPTVHPA